MWEWHFYVYPVMSNVIVTHVCYGLSSYQHYSLKKQMEILHYFTLILLICLWRGIQLYVYIDSENGCVKIYIYCHFTLKIFYVQWSLSCMRKCQYSFT